MHILGLLDSLHVSNFSSWFPFLYIFPSCFKTFFIFDHLGHWFGSHQWPLSILISLLNLFVEIFFLGSRRHCCCMCCSQVPLNTHYFYIKNVGIFPKQLCLTAHAFSVFWWNFFLAPRWETLQLPETQNYSFKPFYVAAASAVVEVKAVLFPVGQGSVHLGYGTDERKYFPSIPSLSRQHLPFEDICWQIVHSVISPPDIIIRYCNLPFYLFW